MDSIMNQQLRALQNEDISYQNRQLYQPRVPQNPVQGGTPKPSSYVYKPQNFKNQSDSRDDIAIKILPKNDVLRQSYNSREGSYQSPQGVGLRKVLRGGNYSNESPNSFKNAANERRTKMQRSSIVKQTTQEETPLQSRTPYQNYQKELLKPVQAFPTPQYTPSRDQSPEIARNQYSPEMRVQNYSPNNIQVKNYNVNPNGIEVLKQNKNRFFKKERSNDYESKTSYSYNPAKFDEVKISVIDNSMRRDLQPKSKVYYEDGPKMTDDSNNVMLTSVHSEIEDERPIDQSGLLNQSNLQVRAIPEWQGYLREDDYYQEVPEPEPVVYVEEPQYFEYEEPAPPRYEYIVRPKVQYVRTKSAPRYLNPTQSYVGKSNVPISLNRPIHELDQYVAPRRKKKERSRISEWDRSTKPKGNSLVKEERVIGVTTNPLNYSSLANEARYHTAQRSSIERRDMALSSIIDLDIPGPTTYQRDMTPSQMRDIQEEKKGIMWVPAPPPKSIGRSKSPPPAKSQSLTKLKNFKWKMKTQVGDIIKQDNSKIISKSSSQVKFDPKSQNYFGKIQGAYKHGYNKDELRDNFEKVVNTDFENPYKKGLKVVDKSNFLQTVPKEQDLFNKKAKVDNAKHYREPEIAGLLTTSESPLKSGIKSPTRFDDQYKKLTDAVEKKYDFSNQYFKSKQTPDIEKQYQNEFAKKRSSLITIGMDDHNEKIKEKSNKTVRIQELLKKPRNSEPENGIQPYSSKQNSISGGFGNSSITGHSMNKTVNLQGTGVKGILKNDSSAMILDTGTTTSQKKPGARSKSLFSQSIENRMEMQKIQSRVKDQVLQKNSKYANPNISKSKKQQGLQSQFFIGNA